MLLHDCNFATVMNGNVNKYLIFTLHVSPVKGSFGTNWGHDPLAENHGFMVFILLSYLYIMPMSSILIHVPVNPSAA